MEGSDRFENLVPNALPYGRPGAEALAAACQLVAAVYATPGDGLRDDLRSGRLAEIGDALARMGGQEPPRWPHAPPPFEALRADYVALFVSRAGGVPAPPYACLVHDGQLLGPCSRRLRAELASLGVRPAPHWHDLPDHIAAVAEAADLLLEHGRTGAARALAGRYLVPWFDRYADAVAQADARGFYAELSRFLRAVLKGLVP